MNSAYTIQKASLFKRIVAFIFDMICVFFLFVAVENLVSHPIANTFFDYNQLDKQYEEKLVEYGIGDYDKDGNFILNPIPEGETDYDWSEFKKDEVAVKLEQEISSLNLFKITLNFMLSEFIVFFLIPVILKNGQTLGKKLIKLGLVSTNEVKIHSWNLFARFAIGIFAFETMINMFFVTFFIIPLPLIISVMMAFIGKKGMALHDYVGGTIVVDTSTTIILDSVTERRNRIEEEKRVFALQQEKKEISQKEIANR